MPSPPGGATRRSPRLSVGVDLVETDAVAASIRAFGDRYLARVFTPSEREYCTDVARGGGDPTPHLAARFAAKEAVMKVLRPAAADAVPWRSIEVVRNVSGHCSIRLHGAARDVARRAGVGRIAISLSHESHYAAAVAMAHMTRPGGPRKTTKREHST